MRSQDMSVFVIVASYIDIRFSKAIFGALLSHCVEKAKIIIHSKSKTLNMEQP